MTISKTNITVGNLMDSGMPSGQKVKVETYTEYKKLTNLNAYTGWAGKADTQGSSKSDEYRSVENLPVTQISANGDILIIKAEDTKES